MWQRIQSVFLGIVILSLVLGLFFYPVWTSSVQGTDYKLFALHFLVKQGDAAGGPLSTSTYIPYCLTAILMAAAMTIAILEFRRFDNRVLQVKLGTLNSLILAGAMICEVLFSNPLVKTYGGTYEPALYLTFVAIASNWLAVRFIRRDEKLVKDSDRLR